MTHRILSLALLLAGCATSGTGRVEVSLAGADAQSARSVGDDLDFEGELYLHVVGVEARFEASDEPDDPACEYGEGFDEHDDDEHDDDEHDDDEHHEDGDWVALSEDEVAVQLAGGLSSHEDPIAIADLPPGAVTELRLLLDEDRQATWILPTGEQIPVTVPSGSSSGLKLKGCMPVQMGYATRIDITVDLDEAMHETGNGEVKLRPSLKVVAELVPDGP